MRKVQAFLLLLVLSALFGCMKSRLDDKSSAPGSSDPNKPSSATVTGRVGLAASANVEVWLYSGIPSQSSSLPVAKTKTDKDGRFALSFPGEYIGSPAYLRAHFKSGISKIFCFVPEGCGNVEFSHSYVIDDSWELGIFLSKIRDRGNYNIGYLADIALSALLDTPTDSLSVSDFSSQYNDYKSAITNRFAAIGDLVQQPLINVTSEAEIATSDIRFIRNSATELAIVSHIRSVSPNATVSQALGLFKRVFNSRGLANRSSADGELSLYGIMSEIIKIVEFYRHDVDMIASLIAQLQANQLLFDVEALDQLERGTASPNANIDQTERAKIFVEDIRQIAGSLDLAKFSKFSDISSFVKGDVGGLLDALGMNVQAGEFLTDENVDVMLESVQLSITAMVLGLLNSYVDPELQEYISDRGMVVSISMIDDKNKLIRLEQRANICSTENRQCDMQFALQMESTVRSLGGNPANGLFLLNGVDLKLTGTVSNEFGSINLVPTRQKFKFDSFKLEMDSSVEANIERNKFHISVNGLDLRIPVAYDSYYVGGDHRLTAVVTGKLDALELNLDETLQYSNNSDGTITKSSESRYAIKKIATSDFFNVAAAVEAADGSDLKASITLRKDEYFYPGNSVYLSTEVSQCANNLSDCSIIYNSSAMEGEDQYHFLGLNTVAVYKATLKGIREPVQMEIGVSRETHVKNKLDHIRVSYPGHSFLMKGEFTNTGSVYKLDAESLDGVKMVIEQPGGFGTSRQGYVKDYDGSIVADIEDMGRWIKITFGDGNFVSM